MKSLPAVVLFVSMLSLAAFGAPAPTYDYPFRNPGLSEDQRIDDVVGRLTLDEKLGIVGFLPAIPRLNLTLTAITEGYHGIAQGGPSNWGRFNPTATTQFPQAYGLAETWDPGLLTRVSAEEATEARFLFQSEKYHRAALVVMAPNTDIGRDPRWGRTEECYGEDPFLVGTMATAFVRGLQGDDPKHLKVGSLLKHFLANSNEDGRFHTSSNFDERLWREYYAKPFEMAVRDGHANAMMASYNAVNGVPQHVSPVLRNIVMKEWGLDGIICTDGGGMTNLVKEHKMFPDLPAAAAACLKAGINLYLDVSKEPLQEALKRGLITEKDLDQAIRGRFRMWLRLGLLDPAGTVPYASIGRTAGAVEPWNDPATHELVRQVTRESIVLLKNDAGVLPVDAAKIKSVAVVGPLANTTLLDWYSGTPPYRIDPREGIENYAHPSFFSPEKFDVNWVADMSDTAVECARKRDVAVVVIGNQPESNAGWEIVTSPSDGKEAVDRKEIALPAAQEEFVRKVVAANPRTIVVLVANFPFSMPWVAAHAPAILQITHASQEQGSALADVIFGDFNPGGKTTQTWPASLDQLPPMMDFDIRHGRTYMYATAEPQYPFGFGLSYTTFNLSNLHAADHLARDGSMEVSVDVTNTGTRAGDEVVQLYVRYPDSKVDRPHKQLRGFQRISVAPGKTQTARMTLRAADLAYWNVAAHDWTVEPGRVELLVGHSSRDSDLALRQMVAVQP
ncbi:MAG TPA: glycoside hydrolase family 3 C-terminal domain-containing protein [Candidatus Didemnitutus sp.]|nr:glycoside hydrolase family 3 C-terminal domain-containing protein [Candidatus Didemnitutus sp.]